MKRFALFALLLLVAPFAHADDAWPSRPVTLIVPFAPGGGNASLPPVVRRIACTR